MRTIRTLFAFLALAIPVSLFGQVNFSISIGPPPLPVYEQPICPGDGYLWTPGYWAYDNSVSDYYWVDGEWVMAPEIGLLWTPGYWGWGDGGYRFYDGYWGTQVGFYGGINYGFGYYGDGYDGGRWDNGHFSYNRSASHVDLARNHNVYETHFSGNNENRVSFNGGTGGIEARATSQQDELSKQKHIAPVASQTEHVQTARTNPELRASANHGRPPVATVSKPEAGNDHQMATPVLATEPSKPEVIAPAPEPRVEPLTRQSDGTSPKAVAHPNEPVITSHPEPINSGNAKADQKYQKQQDNLMAKQNQERQSLQQKQDSEHQRMTQQKSSDAQTKQAEQKHQQQTEQLSQKQQDSTDKKN
jgi:hypothetical protein